MTNKTELLKQLSKHGIAFKENATFSGMQQRTQRLGRVICGESETDGMLDGITFWLHEASDGWFIGLWSGCLFRIPETESVLDLCKDLLSGQFVPSGEPPAEMPDAFVKKYDLIQDEH